MKVESGELKMLFKRIVQLIQFLFNTIQDIEVADITFRVNGAEVDSIFYGTAGLINMHAIIKLALIDKCPHFGKIM